MIPKTPIQMLVLALQVQLMLIQQNHLGDPLRNIISVDAGLAIQYGSIGDTVWVDANANGLQDLSEAPIAGVKVYLLDGSGNKLDSTVTDAAGKYLFDSLVSGTYKVQFVAPLGTKLTTANTGADDANDSDANQTTGMTGNYIIDTTFPVGSVQRDNRTVDAGIVPLRKYW